MTEVVKIECIRCKKSHPETLYAGDDRLCVYCKADIAEQAPRPASPEPEPAKEESVEEKAKAELALRFLTRRKLLPFVERFNPDYSAGWVHKDICKRLEDFSRDVAEKKYLLTALRFVLWSKLQTLAREAGRCQPGRDLKSPEALFPTTLSKQVDKTTRANSCFYETVLTG